MPRCKRMLLGGYIFHIFNRTRPDQAALADEDCRSHFEHLLSKAQQRNQKAVSAGVSGRIDLVAWCILPHCWHLIVRPERSGELSELVRWVTMRHARERKQMSPCAKSGAVYRSRFRSFPIQPTREYLNASIQIVERLPVNEGLVSTAEAWHASSRSATSPAALQPSPYLDTYRHIDQPSPVDACYCPAGPKSPLHPSLYQQFDECFVRNRPFGCPCWTRRAAETLSLQHTLNPLGRPSKQSKKGCESKAA